MPQCDCPNCRKDKILNGTLTTEKCPICSSVFDAKSIFQIMPDKTLVCDKCIKDNYFTCCHCMKLYKLGSDKIVKKINDNGSVKTSQCCEKCFNQNYRKCQECNEHFDKYNIIAHNEKCFCKPCFNKSYQQCVHCQSIVPIGQIKRAIRNNRYVCDVCFEYYGPIDLYERKVKTEFHGIPPHFMGVELEVELEEPQKKFRGKKAQEVLDLFPENYIIVKEDGSINCGFEIVTQPADFKEQIKTWNPFFDKLPSGIISFNTTSCGLHIHCSRKPLSLLTIAKIVVFINHSENQSFVETMAGRGACRYCEIKKKTYGLVKNCVQERVNQRYEAVNLCNNDTIEFRIFKGTLKRESFFKAIEFCDSLVKFCMPANNSIIYCQKKENYMKYVEERKKDYPHLHAFICAKILKKETDLTKKFGFSVAGDSKLPDINVK